MYHPISQPVLHDFLKFIYERNNICFIMPFTIRHKPSGFFISRSSGPNRTVRFLRLQEDQLPNILWMNSIEHPVMLIRVNKLSEDYSVAWVNIPEYDKLKILNNRL